MTLASRIPLGEGCLIGSHQTGPTGFTNKQAEQDNQAFDALIEQFLRSWVQEDFGALHRSEEASSLDEFIEQGALRFFFEQREDALRQLLDHDDIAHHLLRPASEVHFVADAYEPLLARFERRIYNLALQYRQQEVPFRYNSASRRDAYGDPIDFSGMPADQVREDIGMYFGTRRSDETALTILARRLRQAVLPYAELPVHIVAEGYMEESLRLVRATTEQLSHQGDKRLHCFLIQRRHAADDRHLGAALLLMNPAHPTEPQRIIFCDTLKPNGRAPWWDSFKRKVDAVFPQPPGCASTSDRLEDGGVNLQRLHDGVPIRHQDIDCAFYTYSMVRALIGIAQMTPEVILYDSIETIVSRMTARMTEYFVEADEPRDPVDVREENVCCRWNTGRDALLPLKRKPVLETASPRRQAIQLSFVSQPVTALHAVD